MVKGSGDKLTLIVFKDHLDARTFQIPLKRLRLWTWTLALGLFLLLSLLVFTSFLYLSWRHFNPERVLDLEQSLQEARSTLANWQADTGPDEMLLQSSTSTQPPSMLQPPMVLGCLTEGFHTPSKPHLLLSIQDAHLELQDHFLHLSFKFQSLESQRQAQQGRFFILAHGPGSLFAYPPEVLQPQAKPCIQVKYAEPFSFSHFREVKARIGPFNSQVVAADIFVFDRRNQFQYFERIALKESQHEPE
jgi:hypothetical protein